MMKHHLIETHLSLSQTCLIILLILLTKQFLFHLKKKLFITSCCLAVLSIFDFILALMFLKSSGVILKNRSNHK
jgi:hypothetical protein